MTTESWRRVTQWLSVLISHGNLTALATRVTYAGALRGLCVPGLSCYSCPAALLSCPIGTFQHFMVIGQVPWMLIGWLVLIGALVGRLTCGWFCPFGLLQDLMYRIECIKITIPEPLRYLKYVVLVIAVIILPLTTQVSWFSQLCPSGTLSAGIPWVLWNPLSPETGRPIVANPIGGLFVVKLAILGSLLVLFAAAKRPFCRTLCPLGAIYSLFSRVSLLRLAVSTSCTGCNACKAACPVDRVVADDPNSGECVRCLACTRCRHVRVSIAGTDPARLPAPAPSRVSCHDGVNIDEVVDGAEFQ